MALRTNYKDDVFTGKRKYRMTTNPDTTVSFDDETEYVQQGDTYGAAQINAQNAITNNLDAHAYRDSDTAETTLADNDYIPFYDASAGAKRKALFSSVKTFLLGAFAPKSHPSNSASTYGAGNASQFGHVKVSDNYAQSDGTASQSVCASSQAVHNAYANRAPVNHASADTTYGRGSNSAYGHVKLSDTYTSNPGSASEGMGASGKALNDAYNALNSSIGGKAPTNHASATDTYGKGTETEFGHVKLTNSYNAADATAASGVGASGKAVRDLYHKHANEITALDNSKAPVNHAVNANTYGLGNEGYFGHVKLSDATDAGNNKAEYGLGASGKAVADLNNALSRRISTIENELLTDNPVPFIFDIKNGVYGYNTSLSRGADTFHPFKHAAVMELIGSGTAPNNDSSTSGTLLTTNKKYDYLVCFGGNAVGATNEYFGQWSFTTNNGTTVISEGGYYNGDSFAIFQGVESGATVGFSSTIATENAPRRTYRIYGVTT